MSDTRELDDAALARYARQILLPEMDIAGQQALAAANVVVVGCGGLGTIVAPYLWGAGVGRLTLIDPDVVEVSNLPRQWLYGEADLGLPKAQALAARLAANRTAGSAQLLVCTSPFAAVCAQLGAADVLVDCTDNFAVRAAINRHAVSTRTVLVSGAAQALDGQLYVYDPSTADAACYHCLFGEGGEDAGGCNRNGVLGPVVGIIGAAQALQVIQLLAGIGAPSRNRLQVFDARRFVWRSLHVHRDEQCAVCGKQTG